LIPVQVVKDIKEIIGFLKLISELFQGFSGNKILGNLGPEFSSCLPTFRVWSLSSDAIFGLPFDLGGPRSGVNGDPAGAGRDIDNGPAFLLGGTEVTQEARTARRRSWKHAGAPRRRVFILSDIDFIGFPVSSISNSALDVTFLELLPFTSVSRSVTFLEASLKGQLACCVPFVAISPFANLGQCFSFENFLFPLSLSRTLLDDGWGLGGNDVNGGVINMNVVMVVHMFVFVLGDLDGVIHLDLSDGNDRFRLRRNFIKITLDDAFLPNGDERGFFSLPPVISACVGIPLSKVKVSLTETRSIDIPFTLLNLYINGTTSIIAATVIAVTTATSSVS